MGPIRIDVDKNGFLTWDKFRENRADPITKVFCPFNKKMQCNVNCPCFVIGDNEVSFICIGNGSTTHKQTKVFNKK